MKILSWFLENDPSALLEHYPNLPIHPEFDRIKSLTIECSWAIDLDIKSPSGDWIGLVGLFANRWVIKDLSGNGEIEDALRILNANPGSFLELSPASVMPDFYKRTFQELGFSKVSAGNLETLRWFK